MFDHINYNEFLIRFMNGVWRGKYRRSVMGWYLDELVSWFVCMNK